MGLGLFDCMTVIVMVIVLMMSVSYPFRIDDFEFTPERALFDLLGIDLYHGWIVDPQVWLSGI